MTRSALLLAPGALLAAGTFAGAADAATVYTYTDTFNFASTSTSKDVVLGAALNSTSTEVQYTYGLKDGDSALFTGTGLLNTSVYTTDAKPDANEDFVPDTQVKVNPRTQNGDDAYLHLKFDVDNASYIGVARFDVSDKSATDTAILKDVSYDLAPAAAVPEPASWAMMMGGLGVIGGAARAARRRKGQAALATA